MIVAPSFNGFRWERQFGVYELISGRLIAIAAGSFPLKSGKSPSDDFFNNGVIVSGDVVIHNEGPKSLLLDGPSR